MDDAAANYIKAFADFKTDFAKTLTEKGANITVDDGLFKMLDKLKKLHTGITYGSCTLTVSSNIITLESIPFKPNRMALSSSELLTTEPMSDMPYISMLSYDGNTAGSYGNDEKITSPEVMVSYEEINGADETKLYNVTLTAPPEYVFKAYYEYDWVVCSEGFEFI